MEEQRELVRRIRKSKTPKAAEFRTLATALRPLVAALARRRWGGMDNLPQDPGFIVCPNHLSNADPIVVGHYLYNQGLVPHYLAKEQLFRVPVLGAALHKLKQIPVHRDSTNAGNSLVEAEEVLADGGTVVMYPEGTFTRDPRRWPMKGKTGAVRLALKTGRPIVPLAHWGVLDLMPMGTWKLRLRPRVTISVLAGEPVDLRRFEGREVTREVLEEATAEVVDAITALLETIRGEKAPARRWDMAVDGSAILDDEGNPVPESRI